ncbi:DUF805 domain-containing protein [Streptomyces flaveus]|uniref:DUF805 domain-containing protein n=1 Tax=Streptomyces flaveus TaxID=66370 RepID=UPI003329259C
MVGFSEAVKRGFTKTFSWSGRASRAEYWWFFLFILIWYIPGIVLLAERDVPVLFFACLLLSVPWLGVFVRRMHDCGRSGVNWLWSWIPLIGPIVLLAMLCDRGDPETNEYGWPPGSRADW